MDAAFLANLTPQAKLGDLQLANVRVSVDDTAEVVKRLFEECRDLAGVLVVRGAALEGVISRERFLRHMTRPFYPEVFTRRPLRRLLELLHVEPLRLPQSLSVHEAAHRALQRPRELTDEPLIVDLDDGDVRLLSVNVLLLSQSRMLELANETIRRQKDAADAANQAKSRFLANMSHEIRTPMNGILGLTDLLLESETDEEKRRYLVMVKNSADWLVAVINDILDFSKIEAGHLSLDETEFSLRETLGDLLKPLAFRAHSKNVELVCLPEPAVPERLSGDPARLRQVLVNLVGNALKFTDRGEIVIHVGVETKDESGVVLHFQVRDTGIGIPPDKTESIFRAFEQADGSIHRRYGGTGLGLSISARLVELMRGRIWVQSVPGQGSTFHFTAAFGWQPAAESEALKIPPELRRRRVLVVGDHPAARRSVVEMIRRWGVTVDEADERQALRTLVDDARAAAPYHVAVIDSGGQQRSGWELIRRIKQDSRLAEIKLLVLSSAVRSGPRRENREPGLAASLTQPVKPSELYNAFIDVLGLSAVESQGGPSSGDAPSQAWGLRILLAEDNAVNRTLAVLLLEKRGHEVTVVETGRAAVEAWEQGSFDVVLMDVQMPVMDGFEATRLIRCRESGGAHTPIVAMTAHALKGDREHCLEAGMDSYVSKPIAAELLYQAIEDALAAAAGSGSRAAPGATSALGPREPDALPSAAAPALGGVDRPSRPEKPRAAASGESLVDWALARAQVGGDERVLHEVVRVFLDEERTLRRCLAEALAAADAEAFRRHAHSLKGSLGLFGVDRAREAALRLETLGKQRALGEAPAVLETLERELDGIAPELEAFLRQPSKPRSPANRRPRDGAPTAMDLASAGGG